MKKLSLVLSAFLLCAVSVFGQQPQRRQEQNIKFFLDNADRYAKERKYREAAAEITKILEIEPRKTFFFLERARYNSYLKEKEAVLRDVRSAISLHPNDTGVLQRGATYLLLSDQHEESLRIGNSLVARDANNPAGYLVLCETLFFMEDFAGALENYIKVFELNPTRNRIAHKYLFVSLNNLKDDKNIFNYYSRVFNIFEKIVNDSIAQMQKNSAELKGIDYSLKSNITAFGGSLQGLAINWAQLYEKKGETEKAREILEKMVRFEPKIIGYRMRAKYYRGHGRLEEAENDEIKAAELILVELNEWLERYGGTARAFEKLFERGDLYVRIKQFDKAIADYEKAATVNRYFKETAARKIEAALEKMQESANQPK